MTISLPEALRDQVQERIDSGQYGSASDYVRDLIRRDQSGIGDERRWLLELDASLAASVAEMEAGGGTDLDAACDSVAAELERVGGRDGR